VKRESTSKEFELNQFFLMTLSLFFAVINSNIHNVTALQVIQGIG
jgi:hypothetical protein